MKSLKHFLTIYLMFMFCTNMISQSTKANQVCKPLKKINAKNKTMETSQKNVLGTNLVLASKDPLTGYFRTGFCSTDRNDAGMHVVAAILTDEFLKYSLSKGNDLISPNPDSGFPGLKAGNVWCLCALRWKEAYDAGVAPKVILEATNIKALEFIDIKILNKMATL